MTIEPGDREFLDFLRNQEILSAAELLRLSKHRSDHPGSPGRALRELQLLDESAFLGHWAAWRGVTVLSANDLAAEPLALLLLPKDVCVRHHVVPLRILEGVLTLASSDPTDTVALDEVRFLTGMDVTVLPASSRDLLAAIEGLYPAAEAPMPDLPDPEPSPVVQEIDQLFREAAERGASHLHLEPGPDGFSLLFRIDGSLVLVRRFPKALQAGMTARLKILGDLDIAERGLPQSGILRLTAPGRTAAYRISTLPTAFYRERITLSLLEAPSPAPPKGGLGFDDPASAMLAHAAKAREGLYIVSGVASSGRTTTLHSLAELMARAGRSVLVIEDSVSRRIPGCTQVEADPRAGNPMSLVLRYALSQDVDAIVLDPLCDPDGLDRALRGAAGGQLILAGFHSRTALDALEALRDLSGNRLLLACSLRAILNQTLFRVLCPSCKEPGVGAPGSAGGKAPQVQAKGCPACQGTGYRGHQPLTQTLDIGDDWRRWIQGPDGLEAAPSSASRFGRTALRQSLLAQVSAGLTSTAEAMSRA